MSSADDETGFLGAPRRPDEAQHLFDRDRDDVGYVMNLSHLWAHQPAVHDGLFDLLSQVAGGGALTYRQRAILVTATASALGDAYCSLAWGNRLAGAAGPDVAGDVLRGHDEALAPADRALSQWARLITRDPNGTSAADVQALRDVGYDDAQIFAITVFVALRLAFSTVNDALGARPDRALEQSVPAAVRDAVTFGRRVDPRSS